MRKTATSQVNVYQKTIKTLLAKLNDLDTKQQAELQRMHLEDDEKEREKAEVLRERENLEEGLADTGAQDPQPPRTAYAVCWMMRRRADPNLNQLSWTLEKLVPNAGHRLSQAHDEMRRMSHALHEVESKHANVLALQDEAVKFTLQCLTDMHDARLDHSTFHGKRQQLMGGVASPRPARRSARCRSRRTSGCFACSRRATRR